MENFENLDLKPALKLAISELGFDKPTPIQAQALPVLLGEDTDYLGLAATGTGKTAAFGIPLLNKLDMEKAGMQAVVLCPTRELAVQTARQLTALGKHLELEVPAIYGGASYGEQIRAMKTSRVVVATPGRLIDHIERGRINLAEVSLVVLDEADKMISMGFQEEIDRILETVSQGNCRKWLFSATMPPYLKRVTEQYLKNAKTAQVNQGKILSGTVREIYFTVREKNKLKGLAKLIDMCDDFYGLIFCETKIAVSEVTQYLSQHGYDVDSLHGDKDQRDRERTLSVFRERKVTVLVCTEVAARGLDVPNLTHVINYSLPKDMDAYIHRIGRTGRAGKEGLAMSLVSPAQVRLIPRFERLTKTKWEAGTFPSRKTVSRKKLERFIPQFDNVEGHERALEILDETWKAKLEALSKEEIAARFLALALPEAFVDEVEEKEEVDHAPPQWGDRQPPRSGGRGRFDRGDRPRFDRGDRPRFDKPRFEKRTFEKRAPREEQIIDVNAAEQQMQGSFEAPAEGGEKPYWKKKSEGGFKSGGGFKKFGGPKKSFGDRGDRGGFGGPKKSFGDRGPRFGGPKKDFGDRKPFAEGFTGKRFGKDGSSERFGEEGGPRFGGKKFGGPKPFGAKPFGTKPRFGKPWEAAGEGGAAPEAKKFFGTKRFVGKGKPAPKTDA